MAGVQYVVNATDLASVVFRKIAESADGLDSQLERLSHRVADPEVDLEDAKFTAGIISAAKRIDKLSAAMAKPGVNLEDPKFQAEMIKINAQLDRLDARHVTATVDVNVDRGALSRIRGLFPGGGGGAGGILRGFGGAAGAAGSAGQGIGGFLSALGPSAQAALYGAGGTLGVALLPALLPALLGGGIGAGAAGGALLEGSKAEAQLLKLQTSLKGATGANRQSIQQQIAALQKAQGPVIGLSQVGQTLFGTALGTFNTALTAKGAGFSAGPGGQAGAPSFLASLVGILRQLTGFVKALGPSLGDLFRASIPYLSMFVKFLEQATKTLLPVFTSLLRQFTPYLPLIATGLMHIVGGLAGFLKALGPSGMQASAKIFVALTIAMEYVLKGLGIAINWLVENIPVWVHDIAKWWDWMRHHTATVFDGMRHDIAHYWDMIFENSIGTVIRLGHDVERDWNDFRHRTAVVWDGIRHDIAHLWDMVWNNTIGRMQRGQQDVFRLGDSLRHGLANTFDTIRHNIAATWDTIWNNTVGRVQRGVGDVISWFQKLPGRAVGALAGLGTKLYNLGSGWLTSMWNGIKHIWDSVLSWFKNLPGAILKAIGIGSPPKWAINAGEWIMKGLHIGMKGALHTVLGLTGDLGHLITTGLGNILPKGIPVPGNVGGVAALAKAMAAARGWTGTQWDALNAVEMREAGWQLTATNPSSGAYGIAQFINGPGEYAQYGGNANTAAGQITAWLNYIAQRYGNPVSAWAHEQRFGWYDQGGWLPPGLSMALNTTGRPEPVGGAGGNTYNITVNVPPMANAAEAGRHAVAAILEFEKRSGPGWRR